MCVGSEGNVQHQIEREKKKKKKKKNARATATATATATAAVGPDRPRVPGTADVLQKNFLAIQYFNTTGPMLHRIERTVGGQEKEGKEQGSS